MENSLDEPHIYFKTPFGRDRGSLCNRLKTHLLVHLAEDVHRFAGGPHTESKKGEQFNKYIRDSLSHTNRQNTSRVAVRFAEETMLRLLAQDGVWGLNGQQRCGLSVCGFAQSLLYKQHFNGSDRDHADNNFGLRNKFSVGVSALFSYRSVSNNTTLKTIGTIAFVDKKNSFIIVD
jgi:hypothetical protein